MQLGFLSRQQDMRPAFPRKSMKLLREVYPLSQRPYSHLSSAGRTATHFWSARIQTHSRKSASSCKEIARFGRSCETKGWSGSEVNARLKSSNQTSRIV